MSEVLILIKYFLILLFYLLFLFIFINKIEKNFKIFFYYLNTKDKFFKEIKFERFQNILFEFVLSINNPLLN